MFSLFLIVLSLSVVGILAYVHVALVELPPNAKQLCDVWAMVEGQEINESRQHGGFLKNHHLLV